MDARVRDAWQRSFIHQGRFRTHYEPAIVRVDTTDGLTGIGDADREPRVARELLQSLVGTSPWEHLLDDRLGGVLVALYDLIGKAVDLPVSRLFSSSPRSHVRQTWWGQCFPADLMASKARRGADLGYRVHKVNARPWEDPIEQAEAMCEVVPRDMRVWVDANAWWGSLGRTLHF